jgi:hypothetical protein
VSTLCCPAFGLAVGDDASLGVTANQSSADHQLGSAVPVHFVAGEQDGSPTQQRRDAPMLNRFVGLTLAALAAFGAAATAAAPAFALGGCGPNYHQNWAGRCVWGGQNEN